MEKNRTIPEMQRKPTRRKIETTSTSFSSCPSSSLMLESPTQTADHSTAGLAFSSDYAESPSARFLQSREKRRSVASRSEYGSDKCWERSSTKEPPHGPGANKPLPRPENRCVSSPDAQ